MDEKRSARRRRILENAEKRLQKVLSVQSASRKSFGSSEESETDHFHGSEKSVGLVQEKERQSATDPSHDTSETFNDKSSAAAIKDEEISRPDLQEEIHQHQDFSDSDERVSNKEAKPTSDIMDDNIACANQETEEEDNEDTGKSCGKIYRFFMNFLLAVLLVVASKVDIFSENDSHTKKNSLFLPYFFTLELINLVLFPVNNSANMNVGFIGILHAIPIFHDILPKITAILHYCYRTFEDLMYFMFAVVIVNSLASLYF